jgi:hypothetical protein
LISILKVRDSDFDPSLHQFATTSQGLAIEADSESAEAIMASFSRWPEGVLVPDIGGDAKSPRPGG